MSAPDKPKDAIRDAAALVLVRDAATRPRILMGRRGQTAAFLPGHYAFPGGAVDDEDGLGAIDHPISATCMARLGVEAEATAAHMLANAALRELTEETGLRLGPTPLRYFMRAITPPGRPRRFDARFFIADAAAIIGDPDDFAMALGELSDLRWLDIEEANALKTPFITQIALAELAEALPRLGPPDDVLFVDCRGARPVVQRIP